jgi:hypothetical protein
MTGFGGGQGDERRAGEGSQGSRVSWVRLDTNAEQEGAGEQNQGNVYVVRKRSGARYSRITYIFIEYLVSIAQTRSHLLQRWVHEVKVLIAEKFQSLKREATCCNASQSIDKALQYGSFQSLKREISCCNSTGTWTPVFVLQ